jgi:hypothetical protein|tara:strand:+ start:3488 stop:3631 length:144 start_codon:yes stop_codon:yes gene_type:complete
MEVSIKPICGVSLGFEIVDTKYMPELNDDGSYLVIELLIVRLVFSLT